MAVALTHPLDELPTLIRFRQFLRWTIACFCGAAIIYAFIFFIAQSPLAGAIGLICFIDLLIGLVAWYQLNQSRLTSAVLINNAGLCVGALLVVLVAPGLYPADVLVPFLAIAAALPYLHGGLLRISVAVGWCLAIAISLLGIYVDILQLPQPTYISVLIVLGIGAALGLIGLLLWQFSNRLNETLDQLSISNSSLETKNADLSGANTQLTAQIEQQRQLLDLVTTLETPAVPLADGVVFAPIVGHIDSRRAQEINSRLLTVANAQRARLVILDIAGVTVMDTAVAQALIQTTQALRLIGCEVTISGISAQIALTLTHLGVDLHGINTVRSPQEALANWPNQQSRSLYQN